jgi:drug/metabolite transporter (DMT)-like permease
MLVVVTIQHIISIALLVPAVILWHALALEGSPVAWTVRHYVAVAYAGLIASALGFFAYYKMIQSRGPIQASVVVYAVPVVAFVGDYLAFGTLPGATVGIGLIAILGSVWMNSRRSEPDSASF